MSETSAQKPDDLDQRLGDPGFTPSVRALPGLIARIAGADPELAKAAIRALGRVQAPVALRAKPLLGGVSATGQRGVLRALASRIGGDEDEALSSVFVASLSSPDEGVRIAAARAAGKLRRADVRAALTETLARASSTREKEALATALALAGGEQQPSAEDEANTSSTAVQNAMLIAERDALRGSVAKPIDLSVRLPARTEVVLACRRGLEVIVREELAERRGTPGARARIEEERVLLEWSGPISELAAVRVALGFGFSFTTKRQPPENEATAVARLLGSGPVSVLIRSLTPGLARFRLAWADGGKKRSLTWQVAREVRAIAPGLINDPTDSNWEVIARVTEDRVAIDLFPRIADARFAYRRGDVPASSHPTIAAALARVAEVRPDDVVWDPFVGSGLELCERSLLGRYRALVGTDLDPRAITVARTNLEAVGAKAFELRQEDARASVIAGLSCVITNPPMGRRLMRGEDVAGLLGEVIRVAARSLIAGGRIVLLSPHPMSTARVAHECGLSQSIDRRVDLGGFDAVLQRFDSKT